MLKVVVFLLYIPRALKERFVGELGNDGHLKLCVKPPKVSSRALIHLRRRCASAALEEFLLW